MENNRICQNKNCNKGFYSKRKKRYCSKDCIDLKYPNRQWKKEERVCPVCNSKFYAKVTNQKLCSRECADTWNSFEYKAEHGVGGRGGGFTRLRFEVFKRDDFTCTYCGRNVKDDHIKLHCDHIHPKNKGGRDILENLVTACEACNLGKRDYLLSL